MGSDGRTTVSSAVFQHIAEVVMREMDSIVDRKGIPKGFPTNLFTRLTPQVLVIKEEEKEEDFGKVGFELKLATFYGIKIPEVAEKVREEFVKVVEDLTGYTVSKVDIVFDRIVSESELETEEPEEK